jgi:molecular chaperone GrpE
VTTKKAKTEVEEVTDLESIPGEEPANTPETDAPSQGNDLTDQLNQTQAKAAEYLDGWQRARAELDNYRKRMTRERSEWGDQIKVETLLGVLPALDDFNLALANIPPDISSHEWVNGLMLVSRKLAAQLEAIGLTEIDAVGKSFDPELHEAVTHEASPNHRTGDIIGVVRKGYTLNGKVIRPTMVRVAS